MTVDRTNSSFVTDSPPELPGEFSNSLRSVDARLSAAARQTPVPLGLATRVFEASRPMLATDRIEAATQPRLRLVSAGTMSARPLHRQTWARLAMAASFMLACVLAFESMNDTPREMNERVSSILPVHDHSTEFTLQPSQVCAVCHYEANLSYLFETNSMTSEDLTEEIAMLASRF